MITNRDPQKWFKALDQMQADEEHMSVANGGESFDSCAADPADDRAHIESSLKELTSTRRFRL